MRKSMKMVCAMVIGSIVLFSACNKDDDIGAKENKESISKSATESVDMTTSNYIGTEDVQETTEDDYMILD